MRYLSKIQGSQIQLDCDAMNQVSSGAPDILYWTKDRQVIRHSPRITQMGNGTLMVYNMSQSDTGIYECVAKRGRERRTTRTQVSIISLPDNHSHQHDNSNASVTISNPSRFSYSAGSNTDLNNEIITALEESSEKVDKAIEKTVTKIMSHNASKSDAIKAIRYPMNENDRFVFLISKSFELNYN